MKTIFPRALFALVLVLLTWNPSGWSYVDWALRDRSTFDAVKAQQVRLVVLENQCTGFKGYAGEQDNDPSNDLTGGTDCKSGSDRGTIVHAAELEVFGR